MGQLSSLHFLSISEVVRKTSFGPDDLTVMREVFSIADAELGLTDRRQILDLAYLVISEISVAPELSSPEAIARQVIGEFRRLSQRAKQGRDGRRPEKSRPE